MSVVITQENRYLLVPEVSQLHVTTQAPAIIKSAGIKVLRVGGTYEFDTGGAADVIEVPFAWGDATPKDIYQITANKLVFTATIIITTAFNGTSPTLTLGDAGDIDRLIEATQNDPAVVAEFETNPGVTYGTDTMIRLYITPGIGATQGAGIVILEVQQ